MSVVTSMRYLASLALLATTALATYEPGQVCKTRNECNKNCIHNNWAVGKTPDGTDYTLVCDPSFVEGIQWVNAYCSKEEWGVDVFKEEATKYACNAFRGQYCSRVCVLSSKNSEADEVVKSWDGLCYSSRKSRGTVNKRLDEADAKSSCK